jgi:Bacteriophage lambda head decoration protein D
MPSNDSFEFDYVPGYVKPTHEYGQGFGDEFHAEAVQELLLSYAGFTQRGVTLAAGQGVLPTGCIIARHTASGKYFSYQSGATDGRAVPVGVLRDGRDTGGPGAASLSAYNSGTNNVNPDAITLAGGSIIFPASPAGKVAVDALGNMVVRGILNANVVSGTDTTNIINGRGLGSGVGQSMVLLGARFVPYGGAVSGASLGAPFPGGPMDGVPPSNAGVVPTGVGVNAFIF